MRNKLELFSPPRLHTRARARTYAHIYGGNPDAGINMVASRERRYLYWQQLRRDTYPPSVANGRNLFRPVSAGNLADFKFTGTVRIVSYGRLCVRARDIHISTPDGNEPTEMWRVDESISISIIRLWMPLLKWSRVLENVMLSFNRYSLCGLRLSPSLIADSFITRQAFCKPFSFWREMTINFHSSLCWWKIEFDY